MSSPTLKLKMNSLKNTAPVHVPKFLTKTFEILESNKFSQSICWYNNGSAILIKDSVELEKILPVFFKHKNFTSFIRQLNLYGFKKLKNNFFQYIYYHEMFQSGKKNLLQYIKRKGDDSQPILKKEIELFKETEVVKVVEEKELQSENKQLKKLHQDTSTRINALEVQLKELAEQNLYLAGIAMKRENEISHLKSNLAFRQVKELGLSTPLTIDCSTKTSIQSSQPTAKIFQANGAFKRFVRSNDTSESPTLTCNSEKSGLSENSNGDDSESDRKSESSHTSDCLLNIIPQLLSNCSISLFPFDLSPIKKISNDPSSISEIAQH